MKKVKILQYRDKEDKEVQRFSEEDQENLGFSPESPLTGFGFFNDFRSWLS
jgi:hypothetical protein